MSVKALQSFRFWANVNDVNRISYCSVFSLFQRWFGGRRPRSLFSWSGRVRRGKPIWTKHGLSKYARMACLAGVSSVVSLRMWTNSFHRVSIWITEIGAVRHILYNILCG
jgi:hypothetical protein